MHPTRWIPGPLPVARKIYQCLAREFPAALVQIYGPDNKTVPPFNQGFSRWSMNSGPLVKRARIESWCVFKLSRF